jgi:hypothetical protein
MGSRILRTTAFRILTFCDSPFLIPLFWQFTVRPRGYQVGFPPLVPLRVWHSAQRSSVFSISEIVCFCVSWNETLLQSCISFCASRKHTCLIKKDRFHAFYAFWGSCNFYFWSIQSSWNKIGILRWKLIHEHLECTVQRFLNCTKFCGFHIIFGMTRFYCSFIDICRYKLVSGCIIISKSLLMLL